MVSTFFLGACSAQGFSSHYDSLLSEGIPLTVIKGGSGCGKSTFMRSIGRAAEERGLDVSYILCSSDPDSLDGVILPQLPIAFVDGTAPHVLEPKLCGGSMNYLNFGAFYDSAAMQKNEQAILEVQAANSSQYGYITACLGAVQKMDDALAHATRGQYFDEEMEAIAACIALSSLRENDDWGQECSRFLSAVTPKGLCVCSQTPAALCERVYVLRDDYGLASRLLDALLQKSRGMEQSAILCYAPQRPSGKPSHLIFPAAGVAVVSESADFPYNGPSFCRIDLNSTVQPRLRESLEFYLTERSRLLEQAVRHMAEAKRQHDRLEALCKPFVDFDAVTALTERTIQELFD